MKFGSITVSPIFAWYDFWVGCFWDRNNRRLYIFPIPMFGIKFEFPIIQKEEREADQIERARNVLIDEIATLDEVLDGEKYCARAVSGAVPHIQSMWRISIVRKPKRKRVKRKT